MRWSMPIMAYYLLDAGMSAEVAAEFLPWAFVRSQGDEDFVGYTLGNTTDPLVGAYSIRASDRPANWPNGKSQLAADAAVVVELETSEAASRYFRLMGLGFVAEYMREAAREAVLEPVAGYVDTETALQAMIPLPIVPRP